ncbi:VanZ family protein [Planococcus salinus]|uniref:VanZ family protein n=1 Tax=Planococcus salinus TaxID=1848460 RepID=A0A3M8P7B8_9BACL|nr:VanZ family protein [Planococcus salinus]RNF39565.1 VanZ family protein [Planococcus salinus]
MSKFKIIILAAVLAGIYYLSNQPASQSWELSMVITENLFYIIDVVSPAAETSIGELHTLIRKSAHFLVFLLLGFATASVVKGKGTLQLRTVGIALGICIAFAVLDETHQLFVVGRGAQVEDVFIDSFGAAIGIGVYGLAARSRNRRRQ